MATGSAVNAQIGWIIETTAGTYQAPTTFVEGMSEGITFTKNRIERATFKGGRRMSHDWSPGVQSASGAVTIPMSSESIGSLLQLCVGSVSTGGAGPYTHTITPGDLSTATFQVGRPSTDATVNPFSYTGAMVESWSMDLQPDQYAQMTVNWQAENETTAQSLASDSYAQTNFFTYAHGSVDIAGAEVCVHSATLDCNNTLETIHKICSTNPGYPTIREQGMRVYGGTLVMDFEDLTAYNRYVNGTEAALDIVLEVDTSNKLTLSGNVRFDGTTPTVGGPDEVLRQELPFVFTSTTSDAAAFTATLINGDATP